MSEEKQNPAEQNPKQEFVRADTRGPLKSLRTYAGDIQEMMERQPLKSVSELFTGLVSLSLRCLLFSLVVAGFFLLSIVFFALHPRLFLEYLIPSRPVAKKF